MSAVTSRLTVSIVVHDRELDRIVTVHYGPRSWNPDPIWTLPGGKVDPGESADRAAVRELQEETGLVVDPVDLRLDRVLHVAHGGDGHGQYVHFLFAADRWRGEVVNREPHKHLEVCWSPINALPAPMFSGTKAALAGYIGKGPLFVPLNWPPPGAE
ncbi:NUDIX domain-containing protein [Kitasatospora sp. LaBMicrA B282]|uniref:NUDIX domain-containing protein n=1 Tax=Kitasatospora sp. LaBMicrA B282 TaxID=3420949 RepID=UPI003D10D846